MTYKVEGNEAVVDITYNGKPDHVRIRHLTPSEVGYALTALVGKIKIKKDFTLEIDPSAIPMVLMPTMIIAAPFPIVNRESVLNAQLGAKNIYDIGMAIMEFEGILEILGMAPKEKTPSSTSSS